MREKSSQPLAVRQWSRSLFALGRCRYYADSPGCSCFRTQTGGAVREDDRVGRLPASPQPERRGWLAPLAAAVFAAGLAVLLWSPSAVGVFFDDGIYVLLGKALASGDGLHYAGVAGTPPAPKYPPLFPLALAAVWKISPSFPASVPYLKAVGVGFAIVAAGLFAWYVQRALRFPAWFALLTAAGAWATVEVWRYAV